MGLVEVGVGVIPGWGGCNGGAALAFDCAFCSARSDSFTLTVS